MLYQKVSVLYAISNLIINLKVKEDTKFEESDYQFQSKRARTKTINNQNVLYDGRISNHEFSKYSRAVQERFSLFREGEDVKSLIKKIKTEEIVFKLDEKYTKCQIIKKVKNRINK